MVLHHNRYGSIEIFVYVITKYACLVSYGSVEPRTFDK